MSVRVPARPCSSSNATDQSRGVPAGLSPAPVKVESRRAAASWKPPLASRLTRVAAWSASCGVSIRAPNQGSSATGPLHAPSPTASASSRPNRVASCLLRAARTGPFRRTRQIGALVGGAPGQRRQGAVRIGEADLPRWPRPVHRRVVVRQALPVGAQPFPQFVGVVLVRRLLPGCLDPRQQLVQERVRGTGDRADVQNQVVEADAGQVGVDPVDDGPLLGDEQHRLAPRSQGGDQVGDGPSLPGARWGLDDQVPTAGDV